MGLLEGEVLRDFTESCEPSESESLASMGPMDGGQATIGPEAPREWCWWLMVLPLGAEEDTER